jgi:hypothetical protein
MNESSNEVSTESAAKRGLSRRTMIAATAWTVPAVIVATSTPAMAASPGVVSFSGTACKHPGNSVKPFVKDYHFTLLIKNTTGASVNVTFTQMLKLGVARPFSIGAGIAAETTTSKSITVPVGGQSIIAHLGDDNSSQATITIVYTYDGVGGQTSGVPSVTSCNDANLNVTN